MQRKAADSSGMGRHYKQNKKYNHHASIQEKHIEHSEDFESKNCQHGDSVL